MQLKFLLDEVFNRQELECFVKIEIIAENYINKQ